MALRILLMSKTSDGNQRLQTVKLLAITDQGKRLEAIKIRLTGTDANKYSIWYRVHVQNEAWQEWCRDGDVAGTTGQALRAEATG